MRLSLQAPAALLSAALLAFVPVLVRAQAPQNSGPNSLSSTAPPPAQTASPASATVSVPIHEGDPATVTGLLAVRTRAGRQFLIVESPTPYRLVLPPGHLGTPSRVIRDISFNLPGQTTTLTPFAGRTVTTVGKLHLEPGFTAATASKATSWNGALLQATTVILPGGKQLHSKR